MGPLDNAVPAYTSNILVCIHQFLEKLTKIYNCKLALCSYTSSDPLKMIMSSKGQYSA